MTDKSDGTALRARAERYRKLAAEVLLLKERTGSQEVHAACVNLAAGWKSLADKIETGLDRNAPPQGDAKSAGGHEPKPNGEESDSSEQRAAAGRR